MPSNVWYSISNCPLVKVRHDFRCKIQQLILFKIVLASFFYQTWVWSNVCLPFLPPWLLVFFALPIWILIDMQRWIQPLYIHITAYCQFFMLPYTTGLKGRDMYLFGNVNGLLEKTSINTFPGKCQDDVQALRFSKTMYRVRLRAGQHCLYSCKNILFCSVDYFNILFCGINELSILFDGVNELHITFPGVNKLDILFLASMSKIFFSSVNELNILFPGISELNIVLQGTMKNK